MKIYRAKTPHGGQATYILSTSSYSLVLFSDEMSVYSNDTVASAMHKYELVHEMSEVESAALLTRILDSVVGE